MTLEYRCSNCGTVLQTTNADGLTRAQVQIVKELMEDVQRLAARAEQAEAALTRMTEFRDETERQFQEKVEEAGRECERAEQAERQAEADKTMYAEREERLWSELNTMNRQHVASARQMADLGREIERLRAALAGP